VLSLLPSITEIVAALGLEDRLVGITHQCDHPPELVARLPVTTTCAVDPTKLSQSEINEKVAGSIAQGQSLYGIKEEVLQALSPSIIFTQALCDVCAVNFETVQHTCARVLSTAPTRIVSLEPSDFGDMLKTVTAVGEECRVQAKAAEVVGQIEDGMTSIRDAVAGKLSLPGVSRPRVAFLEWLEPLFFGGHWIPDMVAAAGGDVVFGVSREPSCGLSNESLQAADPDVIIVAPCGFSLEKTCKDIEALAERQPWWAELRAFKEGRVYAVEANSYFSRPSPRLLQGTAILADILHGVKPASLPPGGWICVGEPLSQ